MGAHLLSFSVLAMAEVGRVLRVFNVFVGVWLMAAPWLLDEGSMLASIGGLATGIAVIG